MALPGLVVAVALLALLSGPAYAIQQEPTVVTVGDATQGTRNATMWGLATRYMPADTQGKPARELTDQEKQEIWKRVFVLQLYHNALASERNLGRPITDRDMIIKGEKLYLPPQDVIDQMIKLMPSNMKGGVPASSKDQLMRIVLKDVANNKETIAKSKAGQNLTPAVLAAAEQVDRTEDRADRNLAGGENGVEPGANGENAEGAPTEVAPLVMNSVETQDLPDEPPVTDPIVLGPDGQPVATSGSESGQNTTDSAPAGETTSTSSDAPNMEVDLTSRTSSLERLLESAEAAASDPAHPRRDYFRQMAQRIRTELERRKALEEQARQQAAAGSTPTTASAGTVVVPTAPAVVPSSTEVASAAPASPDAEVSGPTEMEYVPDWYLKALQEWNLQQYWQSRTTEKAKATGSSRDEKYWDPATKQLVKPANVDPFGEFSDQLTNVGQDQGVVQKRGDAAPRQ